MTEQSRSGGGSATDRSGGGPTDRSDDRTGSRGDRTAGAADRAVRPLAVRRTIAPWALMAVLAVANGVFRESVLVPRLGDYPAHVLSTAILVALVLAVAALYFSRSTLAYARAEQLAVGVVWVVLTVGFEVVVGLLEGATLADVGAQYDVTAGQVWILVPVALLVAPLVFGSLFRE